MEIFLGRSARKAEVARVQSENVFLLLKYVESTDKQSSK